jgi:hypothetical protein
MATSTSTLAAGIAPPSRSDLLRFATKLKRGAAGCWEWQGFRMRLGYGQFSHSYADGTRRMFYAHRIAYEWFRGPIPDGLTIDHLCRNTCCANPAHLEPVTNAENIRRAAALITHCNYGHEFTPENTYRSKTTGRRECRACNARRGRELRQRRRAA